MAIFGTRDDLRHRPAAAGGRMRDSLFWEVVLPEERLGLQVYLYLTDRGRTGYNVTVWGPEPEPLALELGGGTVDAAADLDDLTIDGLHVTQPELRRTAVVTYASDALRLHYAFEAVHDAFSYHENPDGLPAWFAINRLEQSGRVHGDLEVGGRRIALDGRMGHRDHSWGPRDWGVPQHWKWFVAYTPGGRAVNGWLWIARGEWGFAGYVARDGVTTPIAHIEQHATYDDDMTQRRLDATVVDVSGGRTEVVLERFGLVKLPTNERTGTEIWESACDATIDGEPGAGQWETQWSRAYLAHLVGDR
ncbi:hypothetical protein Acsp06_43120 [Actinomycetospora sp. NBRC 106375]|uniref:DUF7064 domain-containing protein n=1 Tax=Actinomycetospora sp. NBRC 106375 TaxID=3032207 RepID=UPI0024A227EC|nr:hypothetical protein [Actinomycetospora sp. NBRC 106375]GLZ48127.1 hypothetical protein Acsp06_43120 [Actinomycetospora sp. NBRC 106375]